MKKQNLLSRFDALLGPRIEEPPAGFYSIAQLAQRHGISREQTGKKLNDLLAAQKIHRIKGRNSNGRPCWFYGVK